MADAAAAWRDSGIGLLDSGQRAATAYGRPDLAARLEDLAGQIQRQQTTVAVLGEYKAGKSALVNALLGVAVCPVGVDTQTVTPTVIHHADAPRATGRRRLAVTEPGGAEALGPATTVLDPSEVADAIRSADGEVVEIGLPNPLLETGLVLVDTPGAGGLDARHLADALGVLTAASLVLFACDAASELGAPALDLLGHIAGVTPNLVLVLTKADLYLHAERIAGADREHLAAAGLDLPLVITSAALADLARRHGSTSIAEESGLTELEGLVRASLDRRGLGAAERAGRAVQNVAGQLHQVLEAEAEALRGGQAVAAAPPVAAAPGATWLQLLTDEITDLSADLEHDLRQRVRALQSDAEAAIADCDPNDAWDSVSGWLAERAAAEVVATFGIIRTRATAVAARVAERFEATDGSGAEVDEGRLEDLASRVLAAMPGQAALAVEGPSRASAGLNALRSSFYSFSMFSTIGALVGLAAPVVPVALLLGVALGGKSVRDDRKRTVQQRRTQGKASIRTYLDEVTATTAKETRAAVRNVQRELRDHFAVLAAEQQRSAAEAVAAAQQAARSDAASRERRARDVAAEISRLDDLRTRATRLVDAAAAARVAP